jgi:hypothetical protein
MTFTYTGDPSTSDADAVRFLVGDVVDAEHFLEDGEIAWLLTTWLFKGTVYYPASMAAEAIAAKFTREVSYTADGQSLSLAELQSKYYELAASLRAQHKDLLVGGATVYAGGMDSDEQTDLSVNPLAFGTQMHDNISAGRQDFGDIYNGTTYSNLGAWGEQVP